jgi:Protein of unknown function (DUF3592)
MFCEMLLLARNPGPLWFDLAYSAAISLLLAAFILWDRRYRRHWQQYRARNWAQVMGRFDEGEVVTMFKGRSKTIAGYEVMFVYQYDRDGEQDGAYRLPFYGEYKTQDEAEEYRKRIADAQVPVRVSPRNPKRSCVLDDDVAPSLSGAARPNS